MAEFAVSLVGLASTAEVVLTRIYKYIKHVNHADQEVIALSDDLSGLYGILKRVELVVGGFNGVNNDAIGDAGQIAACVTSLDRLRDKLAPFQEIYNAKPGTVRKKWKWPFSRSDTLELKRDIESYKSTLSLTLSVDNVSTTLKALSEAQSTSKKIDRVEALLEAQIQISLDKEKEEVLYTVGRLSPLRHHRTNVSLRHSGTGTWFIESDEFQKWLHTRRAKLWVYGIPGAGKSILAAAAISEALRLSDKNNAVAYFYCDYKDAATQDPKRVLGSLAEQIVRQSERNFERLAEFVKRHRATERLHTFNYSCEDICHLIVDMSSDFESLAIAVDGLDECGDNIGVLLEHLTNLDIRSDQTKMLLSSRDLIDIRDLLGEYQMVSIAARSTDLRLYVAAEIEKRVQKKSRKRLYITDPNLKGEIMDKLIDGAKGMFRWAAVQLDYICDMGSDDDIRSALSSLPPDLFSSYKRLLLDINKKPPSSRLLVQRALKWILSEGAIETKALLEALSVKPGTTCLSNAAMPHEDRVLQLCGSLIRKSADGEYLESAHFTVQEFLVSLKDAEDEEIAPYGVNLLSDCKMFAIVAGNYLLCDEFANPDLLHSCSSDLGDQSQDQYAFSHFPFWAMANTEVFSWARYHLDDPEVFNLVRRLFDHSSQKARFFSLQARAQRRNHSQLEISCELTDSLRFITPLHEAALECLPEFCDYLLQKGGGCNSQSPIGTPLQCAIHGSYMSTGLATNKTVPLYIQEIKKLEATVLILVSHGADLTKTLHVETEYRTFSMTFLALFHFRELSLGIVRILIDAGAILCEDSLRELLAILRSVNNNQIYSLVKSIEPANVGSGLTTQLSQLKAMACQKFEEKSEPLPNQFIHAHTDAAAAGRLFEKVIEYNNQEMLISILDNGMIKSDWRDDDGLNAAHLAAKGDSVEVLKLALDWGVEYDCRSHNGRTPLHYAVQFGPAGAIRLLLSHGADPGAFDNDGQTVLHLAAEHNNMTALQLFQDVSQITLDMKNDRGGTALILAAWNGHAGILHFLLEAGADRTLKDSCGWTAIHFAIAGGHLDFLRVLLEGSRCFEETCNIGPQGVFGAFCDMLLTHVAAMYGRKQCLEFLLTFTPHFDIEDKARTHSLLWFAVSSGHADTVQYLLERGARLTAPASRWTPLHLAVNEGYNEIVNILLRHGHEIHVVNQEGETPLMIAGRKEFHQIFETLKRHAQPAERILDPYNENDPRRELSAKQRDLGVAIRRGDVPYCLNLLSQGVPLSPSCSVCGNCESLVESLNWKQPDMALALINKGAKLTGITCPEHPCHNYTTIHYCARYNFSSVLRKLIDLCPSLLFVASEVHPLYMAIANNSYECLKIMLERSKETWQKLIISATIAPSIVEGEHFQGTLVERVLQYDHSNKIPLIPSPDLTELFSPKQLPFIWSLSEHLETSRMQLDSPLNFAAEHGNVEAAEILLDHGASINFQPKNWPDSPLHKALQASSSGAMVEMLFDRGASLRSRDADGRTCANLIVSSSMALPDRIRSLAFELIQPDLRGWRPIIYFDNSRQIHNDAGLADRPLCITTFDGNGNSPVFGFWRSELLALKTYVLNLDIDLVSIDNTFGSVLHFYWQDPHLSTLRRLLKRLGPNSSRDMLNFKPRYRHTPLYEAAAASQFKVMKLMLDYGAEKDVEGGPEGTALMVAAAYGRENIVKFLVRLGASTGYFDATSNKTMNVFHKAKDFPVIQRWLLVDRWTETKTIRWR